MSRFRRLFIAATILYALGLALIMHMPPKDLPIATSRINDKIAHFLAYSGLATLLYLTMWSWGRSIGKTLVVNICVCLIFGAVEEWTQPLCGRECALDDWLADLAGTLGAVCALTVLRLVIERRQSRASADVLRSKAAGENDVVNGAAPR